MSVPDSKKRCYLCGSSRARLRATCANPSPQYGYTCVNKAACDKRREQEAQS